MAEDLHTYHKGLHLPLLSSHLAQSPQQQDVPDLERPLKRAKGKKTRDSHSQMEDTEEAAQQILLEQPQPEAPPVFPPKTSTRYPPRSNTYLIIGLQNELTKCGILKNTSDYEDFWKLVQEEAPGVDMKEKLQKIKFKMMNPRPCPPAASRRRDTKMLVSTDQDNGSRQGAQNGGKGANGVNRLQDCLKDKQRLLERDGRFADAEHRAGDLLEYMVPSRPTQADVPPKETGVEDPLVPGQQLQALPALQFLKCQSPESSRLKTGRHQVTLCGTRKLSHHVRGKLAPAGMPTDPRPTAPLTLEHVTQTHPVVEAKTARRYWVNYVDEE